MGARRPKRPSPNAVRIAVERVGGRTEASHLLRCSSGLVGHWMRRGVLPNTNDEQRHRIAVLAEASGIPAMVLAGLEPMPRTG